MTKEEIKQKIEELPTPVKVIAVAIVIGVVLSVAGVI